jgi:hypothetical protein
MKLYLHDGSLWINIIHLMAGNKREKKEDDQGLASPSKVHSRLYYLKFPPPPSSATLENKPKTHGYLTHP